MRTNNAFWRALHSLAHPITILAVVTLLVNDHWLRWALPSWWTGKIGDFVWLLFAPFLFALVLAWLIPTRWRKQETAVGQVSIFFIGLWFALAKTVPVIHALTTSTLDSIVGWQGGLRMDATDLITLPSLLISWHIWQKARNTPPSVPLGWVVVALGLMSTMATSCAPFIPDAGIMTLCQQGNTLYALSSRLETFISSDGGLTWIDEPNVDEQFRHECLQPEQSLTRIEKLGGQYDYVPGEGIYRVGADQSQTLVFDLSPLGHDTYKIFREGPKGIGPCAIATNFTPGPHDALLDEQSGNLIFAMGHSGVLVNSGDEKWQWVYVGEYHHVTLDEPTFVLDFLRSELILALGLLILVPLTLIVPWKKLLWQGVLAMNVGWGLWVLVLLLNRTGFDDLLMTIIGLPLVAVAIAFTLWAANNVIVHRRSRMANLMLIVLSLGVALLFLLPYALWVRRTVPNHTTASFFAIILLGGAMLTAKPYFQWRFPPRKKKKREEQAEVIEQVDPYMLDDDLSR